MSRTLRSVMVMVTMVSSGACARYRKCSKVTAQSMQSDRVRQSDGSLTDEMHADNTRDKRPQTTAMFPIILSVSLHWIATTGRQFTRMDPLNLPAISVFYRLALYVCFSLVVAALCDVIEARNTGRSKGYFGEITAPRWRDTPVTPLMTCPCVSQPCWTIVKASWVEAPCMQQTANVTDA